MGRLFSLDSPIMVFLTKIADLMILNVITLLLCIPIVTAGSAITALYYMTIKLVRDEETYIVKGYFKSFKQNFKQATIIWLIMLILGFLLGYDFFIMTQMPGSAVRTVILVILVLVTICYVFTSLYIFPVLSRFDNTIKNTVKNAFLMSVLSLPKTILIILINLLPIVLLLLTLQSMPFIILFGFSGVAYMCSFFYSKTFKKFEPVQEGDPTEWQPLSFIVEEAAAKEAAAREAALKEQQEKEAAAKEENVQSPESAAENEGQPETESAEEKQEKGESAEE